MSAVIGLCLAAIGTYGLRSVAVNALGGRPFSAHTDRTLRHAALGVLTAMIVSTIPHSAGSFGLTVPVVAGLVATTLAARRLSNFAAVIVIGVTATTVLELIVG